jgi:hypothetical protein
MRGTYAEKCMKDTLKVFMEQNFRTKVLSERFFPVSWTALKTGSVFPCKKTRGVVEWMLELVAW